MDIFESLENLNVSEECFNDIVSIVEEKLEDRMTMGELRKKAQRADKGRWRQNYEIMQHWYDAHGNAEERGRLRRHHSENIANSDKETYPDNMTISQAKKVAKKVGTKGVYAENHQAESISKLGKKKKDIPKVGSDRGLPYTNFLGKREYEYTDRRKDMEVFADQKKALAAHNEEQKKIDKKEAQAEKKKQYQAAYRAAKKNGNQLSLFKPNNGIIGKNRL